MREREGNKRDRAKATQRRARERQQEPGAGDLEWSPWEIRSD
jgi:hypothetical protein